MEEDEIAYLMKIWTIENCKRINVVPCNSQIYKQANQGIKEVDKDWQGS